MSKYALKYPKRNVSTARMLRKNMTDAERILWSHLRDNQLGVKFRRQVPVGPYIVDFLSIRGKLIVELDGSQHHTAAGMKEDRDRDAYLSKEAFELLRYSNVEFLENVDGVLEEIYDHLQQRREK